MKLLVTAPWNAEQLQRVSRSYPQVELCTALTEQAALQAIPDAEVVFGDVSRSVFLAAKQLRWIQCHGAGVNKLVAIPELVASNVLLTNTRGAHAATIAEHFFGLLISLTRQFPKLHAAQSQREWLNWSDWPGKIGAPPISLQGLTLGIVGFGHIGRAIATRAHAFEMQIIAVDRFPVPLPDYITAFWLIDEFTELLKRADVVVVTVPGTPETYRLLGRDALGMMKPSAYLCGVSRGGIIDEEALAIMLQEHQLAGAALDVTETEPLPTTSPLWAAPNLILTPHIAGKSEASTASATTILIENLGHYLAGRPLTNVVDKRLGF